MSEMVERVARAMWIVGGSTRPFESLDDPGLESFKEAVFEEARAAIEEMREPTEEMVNAGYDADNGEDRNLGHKGAREAWHLMIDAALK